MSGTALFATGTAFGLGVGLVLAAVIGYLWERREEQADTELLARTRANMEEG